ncbi:MAG: Rod shape-determining protein MreC [Frankiales bacterium]|nr:Rod shape-determining protein MreC [Frankiales bacterium]
MRSLTRRQQIAAAALSVLALLFITLDFTGGAFSGARGGTTGALGSLYRGTDAIVGPARRFVQGIPDVGRDRTELARLQQDNARLRAQLTDQAADASTAQQLKGLQLQADSAGWQTMPTRVVATGPGAGFQWTVTVDVGSREHITAGQTVTDGAALIGRVLRVYPTTSVVLLVADKNSAVGVRDTRSGELLLAKGTGVTGMLATPLDNQLDVRKGDQLVTGPVGQSTYVAGIAVGTVTSVTTTAGGSVTVSVRPAAAQTGLNLIGVVLQQPRTTARAPLTSVGGTLGAG